MSSQEYGPKKLSFTIAPPTEVCLEWLPRCSGTQSLDNRLSSACASWYFLGWSV